MRLIYIVFIFFLLPFSVSSQQIQKIFTLDITVYRNNSLEINDFGIDEGKVSFFKDFGSYSIRLVSFNNTITFQKPLDIDFISHPDPSGEEIQFDEVELYLRLPFSAETKKIQILHNDRIIFDFSIKDYLCNKDNVCSDQENEINCPEDCLEKPKYSIFVIIVSIVVLIILIVIFYRKYYHQNLNYGGKL